MSTLTKRARFQAARSHARALVIQRLYAWDLTKDHPMLTKTRADDLILELTQGKADSGFSEMVSPDAKYADWLFDGIVQHLDRLDAYLTPCLARSLESLGAVERSILRLAALELSIENNLPIKVVLNEAIELSKKFGATSSFKFINGVLHRLSLQAPLFLENARIRM